MGAKCKLADGFKKTGDSVSPGNITKDELNRQSHYNDESIELLLHKIDNHHVHNYLS